MNLRALQRNVPFLATVAVCVLLYVAAAVSFHDRGFLSLRVFVNFFADNSFLGIAALGLTFVILSGGIDLSVGAMIGLVSVFLALAIEKWHLHIAAAAPLALAGGALFGSLMGLLIQKFALPPFLVTLSGMFFFRGLAYMLSLESLPITKYLEKLSETLSFSVDYDLTVFSFVQRLLTAIPTLKELPWVVHEIIPATANLFVAALVAAMSVARFTRFGRNVYALGGSEQSATLMGLPVARTKVSVYALSGFCSALAGLGYCLYTQSGNPNAGSGLELDAIAAVVIGGTLLSGGVGYVGGTVVGVLIFGIIQTAIGFQGTLSSWWTKIVIGVLLLAFILLQKIIQAKKFKTATTFQTAK
jgi:simple sugar transport system permease protein